MPRLKNRKGNRITADFIIPDRHLNHPPRAIPSRRYATPHTLSSAPMPFNRAEDPPDHCMVCTVYVRMYHIAVTHPPTPHHTALFCSVSSPLRSSFISFPQVCVLRQHHSIGFMWPIPARSPKETPSRITARFSCVLAITASHTTQENHIRQAGLSTHHATRYILL